jgi:hypothetical protein
LRAGDSRPACIAQCSIFEPERRDKDAIYMPKIQDHRIVETTDEARAGTTGHNVQYVLAFATVGVIIAFAAIYLYYFAS